MLMEALAGGDLVLDDGSGPENLLLACDVADESAGETVAAACSRIDTDLLKRLEHAKVVRLTTFDQDRILVLERAGRPGWRIPFDTSADTPLLGTKLAADLVNSADGTVVAQAGTKLTRLQLRRLAEKGITEQLVGNEALEGRFLADDVIESETGLVLAEAGDEIDAEILASLIGAGVAEVVTLDIDHVRVGPYIRNTLKVDKSENREEALFEIYRVMRPGEPPTLETAQNLLRGLFFDPDRYDLSAVGRVKMNERLGART